MRECRWIAIVPALAAGLAFTTSASAQTTYYRTETTEVRSTQAEPGGPFGRFRFGVSGVGGAVADGPDLAMGGIELRAGIQLGDYLGIYYMPIGTIGSLYNRPGGESAVAGMLFNNAMVDFTIADMFTIGGGPSIDFIWGCSDAVQNEVECDTTDALFGVNGRVALNLMPMGGPGARHALTLSFDVHPTWFNWDRDVVGWTMLGGIGFEMM